MEQALRLWLIALCLAHNATAPVHRVGLAPLPLDASLPLRLVVMPALNNLSGKGALGWRVALELGRAQVDMDAAFEATHQPVAANYALGPAAFDS
jgi:hypothetical protein